MTDRHTASSITDAALTELYDQRDRARRCALHLENENALLADLYEQWVKAGPPPLGTSVSRWWDTRLAELHAALDTTPEETE